MDEIMTLCPLCGRKQHTCDYDTPDQPCRLCLNSGLSKVWHHGYEKHKNGLRWWEVPVIEHITHANGHIYTSLTEPIDSESGLPHRDHAIVRLQMAQHCEQVKKNKEESGGTDE